MKKQVWSIHGLPEKLIPDSVSEAFEKYYYWPLLLIVILCGLVFIQSARAQWSGEIKTAGYFTYGKFTARLKSSPANGIISAFFLWSDSPAEWREVDFEMLGREPNKFQTNLITGSKSGRITAEAWYDLNRIHDEYHEYSVEWTPDYIAWIVDGQEKRRENSWEFQDRELGVHFNFWPWNINWSGYFNPAEFPLYMYVSRFEYHAYTPGAGPGGGDFTFEWADSFDGDTLNTQTWAKADWGTPGLGDAAPFNPGNVLLGEGLLLLSITNADSPAALPADLIFDPLDETGIFLRRQEAEAASSASRGKTLNFRGGFLMVPVSEGRRGEAIWRSPSGRLVPAVSGSR